MSDNEADEQDVCGDGKSMACDMTESWLKPCRGGRSTRVWALQWWHTWMLTDVGHLGEGDGTNMLAGEQGG
jgi:hypothetical protein